MGEQRTAPARGRGQELDDRQVSSSLEEAYGETAPYGHAAWSYLRGGWSPIPLPAGQKHPPPTGWTGYAAPMASGPDVQAWIDGGHATANVGLRLPETVIGLDVDAYGGKPGEATMREAIARLGPLPRAPRSSARGHHDLSGIRFYRVPPGRRWADTLGAGVEVIHPGHRYAVAWPSRHPDGGIYRWYDGAGNPSLKPPTVDDLPDLPATAWVPELDRGDVADRAAKADVTTAEVTTFITSFPDGQPCQYVARLVHDAGGELAGGASRHDTGRDYVARLVRAGEQGHTGVPGALQAVETAWKAALAQGDPRDPDPGEWARIVTGAVAIVANDPTPPFDKGCCAPTTSNTGTAAYDDAAMEREAAFARDVATQVYRLLRHPVAVAHRGSGPASRLDRTATSTS